jgi:hypothetical protein
VSAGAAGGDKPIAVMLADGAPPKHPIGKLNTAIAKPKRDDAHIEKPKTDDARLKIHPVKKIWMIQLPHPWCASI